MYIVYCIIICLLFSFKNANFIRNNTQTADNFAHKFCLAYLTQIRKLSGNLRIILLWLSWFSLRANHFFSSFLILRRGMASLPRNSALWFYNQTNQVQDHRKVVGTANENSKVVGTANENVKWWAPLTRIVKWWALLTKIVKWWAALTRIVG